MHFLVLMAKIKTGECDGTPLYKKPVSRNYISDALIISKFVSTASR